MSRTSVWVLRVSAVWSIWVWAVLVKNMLNDHNHGLSFRVVHIILAVISLAFAVVTILIAQKMSSQLRRASSSNNKDSNLPR
ncbi:MAG: hypothetical protein F2903_04940 [Actinobacteria bacterium]|uniref:Unannotated protein n=1 Tax=freshwater metagenome TaxID=449393 RepID=A0A6J7R1Y6_9ZZZZ|nr:hypothetical protein [Actinomycetota bacterium]MSX10142.1 hypothetical protein [Actinomycetota bacterium]MSX67339.1 hypothetical protein [Actinomycetota bacterium]